MSPLYRLAFSGAVLLALSAASSPAEAQWQTTYFEVFAGQPDKTRRADYRELQRSGRVPDSFRDGNRQLRALLWQQLKQLPTSRP